MLPNNLIRDMLKPFRSHRGFCSIAVLFACLRISTGLKGAPSERCIYKSTWSDRHTAIITCLKHLNISGASLIDICLYTPICCTIPGWAGLLGFYELLTGPAFWPAGGPDVMHWQRSVTHSFSCISRGQLCSRLASWGIMNMKGRNRRSLWGTRTLVRFFVVLCFLFPKQYQDSWTCPEH